MTDLYCKRCGLAVPATGDYLRAHQGTAHDPLLWAADPEGIRDQYTSLPPVRVVAR